MALLTYEMWEEGTVNFSEKDKVKGSLDCLEWAYKQYGDEIVYACSFGIEGIVLIDLISKIKPDAKIVFLDTDLHFKETYNTIDKVQKKYSELKVNFLKSELTLEEQAEKFGNILWERKPNQCCYYRKIAPLEKELSNYKAWISGLRRDQSETRKNVQYLNKDERFKSVKICPLIHWTWDDIWNYVKENKLEYNPLHDQGYPSIGCEKCTVKATDENNLRSGRWANEEKTECGLHE